jgi:hypothetical protein
LRTEAEKALAASTDPRAASRAYAQAVVADANDADAWLSLARSLLAIKADQGSERYDLPVNASGAALIAYERGQTPVFKASALWVLHDALKRRSYWRPAIDALRASLTLVDSTEGRKALDDLVAEHGFRILEYKVDADPMPRLASSSPGPGLVADRGQYFDGWQDPPGGDRRRGRSASTDWRTANATGAGARPAVGSWRSC